MELKINKNVLSGLLLTVVVTLGCHSAQGQMSCQNLFQNSKSSYPDTTKNRRHLGQLTFELIDGLTEQAHQMTKAELIEKLTANQNSLKDYFDAAHIEYHEIPTTVKVPELKDGKKVEITYSVFRIKGLKNGDHFSRALAGIHEHKNNSTEPPVYKMDLFFDFKYQGLGGIFIPSTREIILSPTMVIEWKKAFNSILRHESQHYLEYKKLSRGEQTLSRLFFKARGNSGPTPYSKSLFVDENESFLRDGRLLFRNKQQVKKEYLEWVNQGYDLSPEKYLQITKPRVKDFFKEYKEILTDSKNTILEIEKQISKNAYIIRPTPEGSEKVTVGLELTDAKFEDITIDLTGMVEVKDKNDKQYIKDVLFSVLEWSRYRLDAIEKEIAFLEAKADKIYESDDSWLRATE